MYLAVFLFLKKTIDVERVRVKILNYLMVSVNYLIDVSDGKKAFDKNRFEDYVDYYQRILEYKEGADSHSLLGFCYYHLGKHDQAIASFQRAAELKDNFFWNHYNLGIIYYNDRNFLSASEAFQNALRSDFKETLLYIATSKVFQSIDMPETMDRQFQTAPWDIEHTLAGNLKSAYEECLILLALCRRQLEDRPPSTGNLSGPLPLKVF